MRKLLIFTGWLIVSLTALIVILFAPYSYDCPTDPIIDAAYSADSQLIKLFRSGPQMEIWATDAERPVMATPDPVWSTPPTNLSVLSPDGKNLLFVSRRGEATLARAEDKHPLFFFHFHANNEINLFEFAPDGKTVLLGSLRDHMAELYDVQTGQLLQSFTNNPHLLQKMAYSYDSKFVITSNTSNQVYVWDIQSGQRVHTLTAASNPVFNVAVSSTLAVSVIPLGTIQLWDVQTGGLLQILKGGHNRPSIALMAIAPDEKTVLTASRTDRRIILWDVQTGNPIRMLCPIILTSPMRLAALLVEGIMLALVAIWGFNQMRRVS